MSKKYSSHQHEYLNPKWEEADRVHDWRNHVPYYIMDNWGQLDKGVKYLMFLWAEELADREEWA